jgi:hypothetical protein
MSQRYLPGTCYTCKKCLFCFSSSQAETCKCKKTIKPKRISKPRPGRQIYPRLFTPNQSLPEANQFLFSANTIFQYNSDFSKELSFTFCSACNSKFQRLKDKDKLAKKLPKTPAKKMSEKSAVVDIENIKIESISSSEFFDEEYKDIEEIKLHVIIDKKGNKKTTSKALTIKPVKYTNVMEKINATVQKAFKNENIKLEDYSISYKAVNARGPSSELEDRCDFNEFIEDYKKVVAAKKKMAVTVVFEDFIDEKSKKSKKHSKVIKAILYHNYFLFFMYLT